MAAALKKSHGVDAELVVGGAGEYTIWLDGRKIAEKIAGRFPEPKDVIAAVSAAQAG